MKSNRGMVSQINVTPLVDVMLVLLIIFMVTTPMLIHGVKVELPHTTASPLRSKKEPIVITVLRDGTVYMNRHRFSLNKLRTKLKALYPLMPDRQVAIRGDGNTAYKNVINVLGAVKAAGFKKVGLVTRPQATASSSRKQRARTAKRSSVARRKRR